MAQQKEWSMNQKQKSFMEVLKAHPEGLTLSEASDLIGEKLASGTITGLITKGLVKADGEKEIEVKVKRKVKLYTLPNQEKEVEENE